MDIKVLGIDLGKTVKAVRRTIGDKAAPLDGVEVVGAGTAQWRDQRIERAMVWPTLLVHLFAISIISVQKPGALWGMIFGINRRLSTHSVVMDH